MYRVTWCHGATHSWQNERKRRMFFKFHTDITQMSKPTPQPRQMKFGAKESSWKRQQTQTRSPSNPFLDNFTKRNKNKKGKSHGATLKEKTNYIANVGISHRLFAGGPLVPLLNVATIIRWIIC